MRNSKVFRIRSLKKDAIICLQMTILFGIIFSLIFYFSDKDSSVISSFLNFCFILPVIFVSFGSIFFYSSNGILSIIFHWLSIDYDMKILCLGRSSKIYQSIVDKRSLNKDYEEIAITGYVKHNLKNLNTAQYFLKDGPLAILPFSKNNFSFVWSVDKEFLKKDINSLVKTKICEVLKTKKVQISNQQSYPLMLNLKRTYYKNDILILGEGLHTVHPVAGQGFNLVMRDIIKLQEILKYYTGLGMSLKSSPALADFTSSRKFENIITGIGIDFTHNFFKQNKLLDPFKETILKNISKNNTLKKISKFISNQGLSI